MSFNQDEKPLRRNLRCPYCKCDDLAFTTEYHKALWLRSIKSVITTLYVLFIIVLIASIMGDFGTSVLKMLTGIFKIVGVQLLDSTNKLPDSHTKVFFILAIIFYVIRSVLDGYITAVESKTHVQAICRVCGNLWLLN
ncbi:MAG: hypothetical protein IJX88_05205 [Clostridia bacterium]|nr:hypothetical protein [Clostridia bacterium]